MKKHIIAVLLLIIPVTIAAQEQPNDTIAKKRISNEYVELYDDYIKIRLGFSNSYNSYHIVDNTDNIDFTLSPNQRLQTTLSLIYKFIEVDIGYTPQFIRFNHDDDIKGKTKFTNFATRLYFGKWMQSLQYAKTRGFYVDADDIGITQNILFPNFQVKRISGSTSYIFNPNFSFRTIFMQSEWQKISTGSFVPTLSYSISEIKNGGPSTDDVLDISIGPAYYYNWVISDKFLVDAGLYAGVGYNNTRTIYDNGTPDEEISGIAWHGSGRLNLGYNSTKIYAGAITNINLINYDTDPQIHVKDRQQFFEFYIGYRFMAPDKVNKFMDNPPKPTLLKNNYDIYL